MKSTTRKDWNGIHRTAWGKCKMQAWPRDSQCLSRGIGTPYGQRCCEETEHQERLRGCLVLDIVLNWVGQEELDLEKDLQHMSAFK